MLICSSDASHMDSTPSTAYDVHLVKQSPSFLGVRKAVLCIYIGILKKIRIVCSKVFPPDLYAVLMRGDTLFIPLSMYS
jgi:hypothetical protein